MRVIYYTLWEQLQRIALKEDRWNIKHIELTEAEFKQIRQEAGEQWPKGEENRDVIIFMGITLKPMAPYAEEKK